MDKASSQESESATAGGCWTVDQQRLYLGLIQNDQAAWAEFYNYFNSELDAYFERQKVYLERDREELVQETMAAVFTALDNYDPTRCSLQGWVYSIARKLMLRRQQRVYSPQYENESTNYDALEEILATDSGLADEDAVGETDHRLEMLDAALNALSVSDQQILKLRSERDDRHVTFADIGEELGIRPNAAKMRYSRALKRLRKKMADLQNQPRR